MLRHIPARFPKPGIMYRIPALLLAGVLTLACTDSLDSSSSTGHRFLDPSLEEEDIRTLEARRQMIEEFIGTPRCTLSGDCAALPLGVKPCGGPWFYLVYSRSSVDTLVLQAMASGYDSLNDELNRRWGWGSDCEVISPPTLACRDGVCVDTLAVP